MESYEYYISGKRISEFKKTLKAALAKHDNALEGMPLNSLSEAVGANCTARAMITNVEYKPKEIILSVTEYDYEAEDCISEIIEEFDLEEYRV